MSAQGVSARLAKLDLAIRMERRSLFGPVVSGPDGWDLILILYLADANGSRLTVRQAVEQAGGDFEAGHRRMGQLGREGLVIGDGDGRIDDVVTLAPEGVTRVDELIERTLAAIDSV